LSYVLKIAGVTQKLIWIGWAGLAVSGIPLLIMKGSLDNLIDFKIFLVLLVGLNGLIFEAVRRAGEKIPGGAELPPILSYRLGLAAATSQLGWWGTAVVGFIHSHIDHVVQWPRNPWLVMAVIAALFLGAHLAGGFIFRTRK